MVYPFLECAIGIDYITLPTTDFIEDIKKDGFKDSQILCTGLPVKEQFNQVVEKSYARKQLNIDENLFTIMVIFGGGHWSGGFKIFKDVISCLKDVNAQIIMINGKNKSSFNKIAKMKFPTNIKVVNVGFTNQVDLYMSASDIVISKLGGQGGTEIINKLRPIVVTDKVYGQELCNLKYLKQYGIVQDFKNKTQLKQIVTKLMNDTQFYNNIVEQEKKFKNDALNTIAEKMLSFENAIYKDLDIDYSKVKSNVKKAIKKAKRNK